MDGLIDTHRHFLPSSLFDGFARRSEPPCVVDGGTMPWIDCGSGHRTPVGPLMRSLDLHLEQMDRHGIDAAVLAPTMPGVDGLPVADAIALARAANDELAELCRESAGRFAALAVLPTAAPEAAADELRRACAAGLVGAQVLSNVGGEELYDERFRIIFDTAAGLGAPIRIHPTVRVGDTATARFTLRSTLGHVLDSSAAALGLILDGTFERNPDLRLVVPHAGGVLPYLRLRADHEVRRLLARGHRLPGEDLPKLYSDTAFASPGALALALDELGRDHVMVGSDVPLGNDDLTAELLREADLDESSRAAIAFGTAERVFGLRRPVGQR